MIAPVESVGERKDMGVIQGYPPREEGLITTLLFSGFWGGLVLRVVLCG